MLLVGVDIGGTKVAAGLVDGGGKLLFRTSLPSRARESFDASLSQIRRSIEESLREADRRGLNADGVGLCAAGPLDYERGLVMNPPNLPAWKEVPLAAIIGDAFDLEVRLENDANAAALAEMMWGAARGCGNVFFVTVGTGIGTALIVDGRLYRGRKGMAGEGGHMTVDSGASGAVCGCGNTGCIEALASGPAVERRAAEMIGGRETSLADLRAGGGGRITMEMIGEAAKGGDAFALELVEEMGRMLGVWLGGIINLLDPEVIVIGGGVSSVGKPLFGAVRASALRHTINPYAGEIPILPAALGADAGIYGGAALFAARDA